MLTATEAVDLLNLLRECVVTALGDDTWLCADGTGGIASVRESRVSPDARLSKHEMPALLVLTERITSPVDDGLIGACRRSAECTVEYRASSGDMTAGTDAAREVIARLVQWINAEISGGRLDGLLSDGDRVRDITARMIPADRGFDVRAEMVFTADFLVEV
jgi:hypothetical protein